MALHFSREELAARRAASIAAMQKRGLDGLLMFRQESMYYLTGYDTFGYVYFQCLYLGADGLQLHMQLPLSLTGTLQGMLLFLLLAADVLVANRVVWRRG